MRQPKPALFRRQQLEELKSFELRSNALVDIEPGRIRVNGTALHAPGPARVLFVVLAKQAARGRGKTLSGKQILEIVQAEWRELAEWSFSQPRTLVQLNLAMHDLREALKQADLDPALVETVGGRAYRLSVPSINVSIAEADAPSR